MRSVTKFDLKKMVELYDSGLSKTKVAEAMGCSPSVVDYHLRRERGGLRPPKKVDWPIEQMRQWYEVDGLSLQDIADRLGQKQKVVNKVAKRNGFVMKPQGSAGYRGERSHAYKNGRTVDKAGYILVLTPDHPNANVAGYVREHRLVAEKTLGRYLLPTEAVHHVNDDPSDNRPENLVVYETNGQHLAETLAGKCPKWSEDGKRRLVAAVRKPRRRKGSPAPSKPGEPVSR